MNEILTGKLVRLSAFDPEEVGKAFSSWTRDSEYWRLMTSGAAYVPSIKEATRFFEKELEEMNAGMYAFGVRTVTDNKLIGEMVLEVVNWSGRDAFVGLSIGDRANWGQGYGTEMMVLILRYAFMEVNLRRVSLAVFEYNPRAIRTYEKAGFRPEGRVRGLLNREGKRWDMLLMGVLREEWLQVNQ